MKLFSVLLVAVASLFLSGCGNSAEVRYRVTVEVDDNGATRSGSSVWSFKITESTPLGDSGYRPEFHGEAVAVDLSEGQTLFALVKGQEMLPERHFKEYWLDGNMRDRIGNVAAIAKQVGASKILSCEEWQEGDSRTEYDPDFDCPMLVTFTDIADPTSVALVEPDDLAASFWRGRGPEEHHRGDYR